MTYTGVVVEAGRYFPFLILDNKSRHISFSYPGHHLADVGALPLLVGHLVLPLLLGGSLQGGRVVGKLLQG